MELTGRKSIVLAVAVGLLVLLVFFAGVYLEKEQTSVDLDSERTISLDIEPTNVPERRPIPGSSEFTPQNYIQPLENNATGSIYSPRAQIRGVVSSWSENTLVVNMGDKELSISLPQNLSLRCLPLTKTSADGTTFKMADVFVDLSNAKGTPTDVSIISEQIPVGADITLQVAVDEENNMTADLILGYGCSI